MLGTTPSILSLRPAWFSRLVALSGSVSRRGYALRASAAVFSLSMVVIAATTALDARRHGDVPLPEQASSAARAMALAIHHNRAITLSVVNSGASDPAGNAASAVAKPSALNSSVWTQIELPGEPLDTFKIEKSEEGPRGSDGNPVQTYRTVCVRLCDGLSVPVSFTTTSDRLLADAQRCHASCDQPTRLYLHRDPAAPLSEMRDLNSRPYSELVTAFRFRTEVDAACACNPARRPVEPHQQTSKATPP